MHCAVCFCSVFWKAHQAGVTVKKAKLERRDGSSEAVPDFAELYPATASGVTGRRLVRARYPNA
jgi:hypothetical protein